MLTTGHCGFQPPAESDARRARVSLQSGHIDTAPENQVMPQASHGCPSEDDT